MLPKIATAPNDTALAQSAVIPETSSDAVFQQSHQFLRSFIDNAPLGVAIACAASRKLLKINNLYRELLGYTEEEIFSLTFDEITHPDDLQADLDQYQTLLAREKEQFKIEKRFKRKDGAWLWTNVTVTLIYDSHGQEALYSLAMVEDISSQKAVAEALVQSEARNRAIVEALPDAVYRLNESGIYLEVPGEKSSGLTESRKIVGESIYSVLPTTAARSVQSAITRTLESGQFQSCHYEQGDSDFPQYYEARILNYGQAEVLAIVRDITNDRKIRAELDSSRSQVSNYDLEVQTLVRKLHQLQIQIKQTEKLVTLGTVAAGTAEEVRRQLAQIRAEFSQLCEDQHGLLTLICLFLQYYPTPPEAIRNELEVVDPERCLRRIPKAKKVIINRLHDADCFADFLETIAKSQSIATVIDIHECLSNVIRSLQPGLRSSNIQIHKKYKGTPYLRCYPGHLYHALLNLFQNAIAQIDPHSKVRTTLIVETASSSEGELQIMLKASTSEPQPMISEAEPVSSEYRELDLTHRIIEDLHRGKIQYPGRSGSVQQLTVSLPAEQH
jgi:PAS domain S-box-containing protein